MLWIFKHSVSSKGDSEALCNGGIYRSKAIQCGINHGVQLVSPPPLFKINGNRLTADRDLPDMIIYRNREAVREKLIVPQDGEIKGIRCETQRRGANGFGHLLQLSLSERNRDLKLVKRR